MQPMGWSAGWTAVQPDLSFDLFLTAAQQAIVGQAGTPQKAAVISREMGKSGRGVGPGRLLGSCALDAVGEPLGEGAAAWPAGRATSAPGRSRLCCACVDLGPHRR